MLCLNVCSRVLFGRLSSQLYLLGVLLTKWLVVNGGPAPPYALSACQYHLSACRYHSPPCPCQYPGPRPNILRYPCAVPESHMKSIYKMFFFSKKNSSNNQSPDPQHASQYKCFQPIRCIPLPTWPIYFNWPTNSKDTLRVPALVMLFYCFLIWLSILCILIDTV